METTATTHSESSPGEIALENARETALQSAHAARLAGLAKAREIKKEKAAARAEGTLIDGERDAFWREVYLTLARNREARGAKDWAALIAVTDEIIELLDDAGKI